MVRPEDLITYCGLYGGYCSGWRGNSIRVRLAAALAELVDETGCQHWIPDEVKDFDYVEFRKGLDFFMKDPRVICQRCCKGGGGSAECETRKCCEERGLELCFECSEFPCSRVEGDAGMKERAKEYKELGRDEWLRRQIEKANEGYEQHTAKYWKLYVSEHPLSHKEPLDQFEDTP